MYAQYNLPFFISVKTKIGQEFLRILDTSFPQNNPLKKLLNRNTVKISYKCMPSMAQAVSRHNTKLARQDEAQVQPARSCNCNGVTCPVQWRDNAWRNLSSIELQWHLTTSLSITLELLETTLRSESTIITMISGIGAKNNQQPSVTTFGIWKRVGKTTTLPGIWWKQPQFLTIQLENAGCVIEKNGILCSSLKVPL